MAKAKPKFKVLKKVTMPLLKIVVDVPIYVEFTGAIHTGKKVQTKEEKDKNKPARDPADLAPVIDLETGEECEIIMNAVCKGHLTESYPDDGYVGLQFSILKRKKNPGKDYFPFDIQQIEWAK